MIPPNFILINKAKAHYYDFIKLIVNRKNTAYDRLDGKEMYYRDDPTIMAWQLANEPRAQDGHRCEAWEKWVKHSSELIKSLDKNHLVSIGTEGAVTWCTVKGNSINSIDYMTVHAWAQNWGWYSPQNITNLYFGIKYARDYIDINVYQNRHNVKPMVLEEFGLARDNLSYDPNSSVDLRDSYFRNIFQYVYDLALKNSSLSGVNFWAYGGVGRPRENGGRWEHGDDLLGDPPHEAQGWYSIYDTDDTTISILREFSEKFLRIYEK
jgi:mannan endo-1,4-beta-mannosidase